MDIKRLILFVVFSFSIMMLWDGWQTKNNPQLVLANQAVDSMVADAGVPQAASTVAASELTLSLCIERICEIDIILFVK